MVRVLNESRRECRTKKCSGEVKYMLSGRPCEVMSKVLNRSLCDCKKISLEGWGT